MIIWICGLSGSGKSTIALELSRIARREGRLLPIVDGDTIRDLMGTASESKDYSVAGRRRNAENIERFVTWLDIQGIDAVVAVQSLFHDLLKNHRSIFANYFEVHLDATLTLLQARDPKGLHRQAVEGDGQDIVGYGIPYERPSSSDLYVDMDTDTRSAQQVAEFLYALVFNERRFS